MILRQSARRNPIGVWIDLLSLLLKIFATSKQRYSLLDLVHAVKLGFQNARFIDDSRVEEEPIRGGGVELQATLSIGGR